MLKRTSRASFLDSVLCGVVDRLTSAMDKGGLDDPTLPGKSIATKATADQLETCLDLLTVASDLSKEALAEEDECKSAKTWRKLLGKDSEGNWVFPSPTDAVTRNRGVTSMCRARELPTVTIGSMTAASRSVNNARLKCMEGLLAAGFEESTSRPGHTTLIREFELLAHDGRSIEDDIEVTIGADFPYTRPLVRSVFAATGNSWHREPSGNLCLWPHDNSVADLPWKDPAVLIGRIEKWLQCSADGWEDDMPILDLERYVGVLPERFLITSSEVEFRNSGYFNVKPVNGRRLSHFEMGEYVTRPPIGNDRRRRGQTSRLYGAAIELDELSSPFASWTELADLLPSHLAQQLDNFIRIGVVHVLLVQYSREGHSGSAVLSVSSKNNLPSIRGALVPVPTSRAVRRLRAGSDAAALTNKSVAIVGVGAVGSYVADLLTRRGVGSVLVVDPDDMRPGNAVRHLIGEHQLELAPKVDAIKAHIEAYGFVADGAVTPRQETISSVEAASGLLSEADLVVDATASGECSALLSDLADESTAPVVAVALQRDGAVYRIDQYPGADHYPPIDRLRSIGTTPVLETGCADPISPTTPDTVVEAAVLRSSSCSGSAARQWQVRFHSDRCNCDPA